MPRLLRLIAAGIAATIMFIAPSQIGFASLPSRVTPNEPAATIAAADWIVAQLGKSDHVGSGAGDSAGAAIALVAAGDAKYATARATLTKYLKAQAKKYAVTPEASAMLAITAMTLGEKATDFGGVDLIGGVKAGTKADGSFGSYPGPFASGLGIVALARAGEKVPDQMVRFLLNYATSDGGFTYAKDTPTDADSTGMALLGLLAAKNVPDAADAATKAADWAAGHTVAPGYWEGYSPVNSTAIMGSAMQAAGKDVKAAATWVAAQATADGGLPNAKGGQKSDLLATTQGILLLAGTDYLKVGTVTATPSPTPQPDPNAPASPTGPFWGIALAVAAVAAIGIGYWIVYRKRKA